MKIFVAGATGAIGKQLVPKLVERGHTVVGQTRTAAKADDIRGLGGEPAIADALDRDRLVEAVARAAPDVVVHELTELSSVDMRRFERSFAGTNRLRTDGTDNLLAAARAAGATRFVAQSYAGWPYAYQGGPAKTEDDPLNPDPPAQMAPALSAIRYLERAVLGVPDIEGIVLRYGGFYGPGTGIERGGPQFELVQRRRFPVVGDGHGVWSFVHIEDAADATVAAIERGARGIYNVVDDEPARVCDWLPYLADAIGARPPRHLPRWLGRVVGGAHLVALMTEVRGASNEKARRALRWEPGHPSWRTGFLELAG